MGYAVPGAASSLRELGFDDKVTYQTGREAPGLERLGRTRGLTQGEVCGQLCVLASQKSMSSVQRSTGEPARMQHLLDHPWT